MLHPGRTGSGRTAGRVVPVSVVSVVTLGTRLARRYAACAAVASVLTAACAGCGGCGAESASTITAPSATTSASATAAVTAPPAGGTPTDEVDVFSGTPAPATTGPVLQITALPGPAATVRSTPEPRTTTAAPLPTPLPTRKAPQAAAPEAAVGTAALRIVQAPIPFSDNRKQEMAAYSLRHYGSASWRLSPSMIVLHFTAGGTAASTRNVFAVDTPNAGELPGTCAHFVVDKDGTVYALVPTSIRCRHTIGLNDKAIGIEMVQEAGGSSSWADQQILNRPAQVDAALALVRQLQSQYGITTGNVVGHATANTTPQFHDLTGARNDHTDWQAADVATFRSRL